MATDSSLATSPVLPERGDHALLLRDARSTNLLMVQTIGLGLERDLVGTSVQYGLNADQAHRLLTLEPQTLAAKAASIGNQSLALPREDLLDTPQEVRTALAVASPARASSDGCALPPGFRSTLL
jgi:hypothetical protein